MGQVLHGRRQGHEVCREVPSGDDPGRLHDGRLRRRGGGVSGPRHPRHHEMGICLDRRHEDGRRHAEAAVRDRDWAARSGQDAACHSRGDRGSGRSRGSARRKDKGRCLVHEDNDRPRRIDKPHRRGSVHLDRTDCERDGDHRLRDQPFRLYSGRAGQQRSIH